MKSGATEAVGCEAGGHEDHNPSQVNSGRKSASPIPRLGKVSMV